MPSTTKIKSIFQSEPLTWADNAECKLTLHTNCRNTKEIARTSARNIGLDSKTFINSPVKGEQAFVAEYADRQAGLQLVERIITSLVNERQARPEEIAILSMTDHHLVATTGKKTICGLPTSKLIAKGHVCVNTVDDFKGLEASYLILTDISVSSYADIHYRNRLYIGCSRAKQGLYMLFENPSDDDYRVAMTAIETKTRMKKNKATFYKKLAVTSLEL